MVEKELCQQAGDRHPTARLAKLGCLGMLHSPSVTIRGAAGQAAVGRSCADGHEELQRARKEALRGEVGCLEEGRWQLACR